MPTVEAMFHGLAVRYQEGEKTWVQIGQGKQALTVDIDGVAIKGKRHVWRDVEGISVSTVQRSPGRSLFELAVAVISNQPGTQAGTFVSVLVKSGAFEKTYRCGSPLQEVTPNDDSEAAELLMRLRDQWARAEFFGS